jgi:putative membrane protein
MTSEPISSTSAPDHAELAVRGTTPAMKSFSSRTRDHLANERTYLAWMRTAIALMGFGVLIARIRYLLAPGTPGTGQSVMLGLMFAVMGVITVALSTQHYFAVRTAIDRETYEPSRRWILLLSLMVLLLGSGVIGIILVVPHA